MECILCFGLCLNKVYICFTDLDDGIYFDFKSPTKWFSSTFFVSVCVCLWLGLETEYRFVFGFFSIELLCIFKCLETSI